MKTLESLLRKGDNVEAQWSDGLILTGSYLGSERGYILLRSPAGERIVCGPGTTLTKISVDKN